MLSLRHAGHPREHLLALTWFSITPCPSLISFPYFLPDFFPSFVPFLPSLFRPAFGFGLCLLSPFLPSPSLVFLPTLLPSFSPSLPSSFLRLPFSLLSFPSLPSLVLPLIPPFLSHFSPSFSPPSVLPTLFPFVPPSFLPLSFHLPFPPSIPSFLLPFLPSVPPFLSFVLPPFAAAGGRGACLFVRD